MSDGGDGDDIFFLFVRVFVVFVIVLFFFIIKLVSNWCVNRDGCFDFVVNVCFLVGCCFCYGVDYVFVSVDVGVGNVCLFYYVGSVGCVLYLDCFFNVDEFFVFKDEEVVFFGEGGEFDVSVGLWVVVLF